MTAYFVGCYHTTVTLLSRYYHTTVTLLSHCCHTTVTLLSCYCYTTVTLQSHYGHATVTLLSCYSHATVMLLSHASSCHRHCSTNMYLSELLDYTVTPCDRHRHRMGNPKYEQSLMSDDSESALRKVRVCNAWEV